MLLRAIARELEHQDHGVIYKSCLASPSLNEIVNIFGVQIDRSQKLDDQQDRDDEAGTDRGEVFQLPESQTTLLLDDADGLTEEIVVGGRCLARPNFENGFHRLGYLGGFIETLFKVGTMVEFAWWSTD